jgi:hypothetical protein
MPENFKLGHYLTIDGMGGSGGSEAMPNHAFSNAANLS